MLAQSHRTPRSALARRNDQALRDRIVMRLRVVAVVTMGWHASDEASASSFVLMMLLNILYH
jgi:hypothetical protein